MLPTSPSAEADRIALSKMFKAIAEYGRKVRLHRQAECAKNLEEDTSDLEALRQQVPTGRTRKIKKKKQTQTKTE